MDTNKLQIAAASENDIEFNESVSEESAAPLNLETLNSDCQQLILDYFEVKDLLNVAETSKTLKVAACLAFKRKYGQRNVGLYSFSCTSRNVYFENGKGVLIRPNLDILKTLRNFGCAISNLILSLLYPLHIGEKVILYVIEYCSKSLETLRMDTIRMPQQIFQSVEKPFVNLKKLYIHRVHYELNVWRFDNAVFPNLQALKLNLNCMDTTDLPKIEIQALPALKSFSFDGTRDRYNDLRNYTDIVDMIKLNTQLEKLEIALLKQFNQQNFGELMQCIMEYLPNLQSLNFIFSGPKSVFNALHSYHFNNVINFGLFNIPCAFSTIIPFTFNKLKRFTITTADKTFTEHLNHAHIWDFMANNKDLTSIFLHGNVNGTLITNYEHVFVNVDELYIHKCQDIPLDSVLRFSKNRLNKFSISGTKKTMKYHLYQDLCDILKVNEIEFNKLSKPNGPFEFGLELIIKRMVDCSLMSCVIESNNHSIEPDFKFYSKNKLECYMPPINPYYAKYYTGPIDD